MLDLETENALKNDSWNIGFIETLHIMAMYFAGLRNLISSGVRGVNTLGRFSAILFKGNNFCDDLFFFLHT